MKTTTRYFLGGVAVAVVVGYSAGGENFAILFGLLWYVPFWLGVHAAQIELERKAKGENAT